MRDLSMHVLDIVQNSIKAGAKLIAVSFVRSPESLLTFTVKDDGCGMSPEFLARVTDPFTTTRTTRRVGLGIPMLKQSAEAAGGSFSLESEVGEAEFDTRAVRQALGGVRLNEPDVGAWIKESIDEEFKPILEVLP